MTRQVPIGPGSVRPRQGTRRREQLAAQPWPGLGGLLLALVVFFALALGTPATIVTPNARHPSK
jgi:hypothetical protein